ncbi:hypothetical protein ACIQUQ_26040 [Streptomyces sp. NPDC101118]|uniref:hypothetical protein n=1 Tax=Streptomyces sp. NPDC101118 TaxID=3366109 RepID=UPI003809586A
MSVRGEKLKGRATLSLVLVVIAAAVFFLIGSASQQPAGWGAAYAFGKPVTLELPTTCGTETIGSGRTTSACKGTKWTADGRERTGTLYAYRDQIDDSGSALTFKGEARALFGRAYGAPAAWLTWVHVGAVGLAALAVLILLVSLLLAAVPGRRR